MTRSPGRGSALTADERLEIRKLRFADGLTVAAIARKTRRDRSTVSAVLAARDSQTLVAQLQTSRKERILQRLLESAERALLDRLPYGEGAAKTLEQTIEGVLPRLTRTTAQTAIQNLMNRNQVQRVGKGKKGDGYRYFRTVEDSAGTQITRCGRNGQDETVAPEVA